MRSWPSIAKATLALIVQSGSWLEGMCTASQYVRWKSIALTLTCLHACSLGTYCTMTLRRYEGENLRTFKVQLIRGPPNFITLLDAMNALESSNVALEEKNIALMNHIEELRNKTLSPARSQQPPNEQLLLEVRDLFIPLRLCIRYQICSFSVKANPQEVVP
jgi:hypothetical protein